ncbi:MAG: glutamate--tRNA ligase family protein [Actinomycetaceae bacterium]|nr:glutamate--tRNA ligase family protein [Actinomycetaceae bacterium]MDY6082640.1 glutamate--tRNA ligase family protein [Actinomycetaceae bacterium]
MPTERCPVDAAASSLSARRPEAGGVRHESTSDFVGFGRFAPSPTGDFHLGNLRTALLAWALARNSGRGFLIRMEDLDARSRAPFVSSQLADLEEIGIDWDGEVVFQSARREIYRAVQAQLADVGLLYECYCTRKELAAIASAPHRPPGSYPGTCRNLTEDQRAAGRAKLAGTGRGPALRLRADVSELAVSDDVYGTYCGAVDDMVIVRGDGVYSYNFISVLDDALQGVSQIVRGADLLPSTPRQVHLQHVLAAVFDQYSGALSRSAFDADANTIQFSPRYAHVPMVLRSDGARLAKRDGAVTLRELADLGWQTADVVQLLAASLGYADVRSAREFAQSVQRYGVPPVDWYLDPDILRGSPNEAIQMTLSASHH